MDRHALSFRQTRPQEHGKTLAWVRAKTLFLDIGNAFKHTTKHARQQHILLTQARNKERISKNSGSRNPELKTRTDVYRVVAGYTLNREAYYIGMRKWGTLLTLRWPH